MNNQEKANEIYFWVGTYLFFVMLFVIILLASINQHNTINRLIRQIETKNEIIEVLETDIKECNSDHIYIK